MLGSSNLKLAAMACGILAMQALGFEVVYRDGMGEDSMEEVCLEVAIDHCQEKVHECVRENIEVGEEIVEGLRRVVEIMRRNKWEAKAVEVMKRRAGYIKVILKESVDAGNRVEASCEGLVERIHGQTVVIRKLRKASTMSEMRTKGIIRRTMTERYELYGLLKGSIYVLRHQVQTITPLAEAVKECVKISEKMERLKSARKRKDMKRKLTKSIAKVKRLVGHLIQLYKNGQESLGHTDVLEDEEISISTSQEKKGMTIKRFS